MPGEPKPALGQPCPKPKATTPSSTRVEASLDASVGSIYIKVRSGIYLGGYDIHLVLELLALAGAIQERLQRPAVVARALLDVEAAVVGDVE